MSHSFSFLRATTLVLSTATLSLAAAHAQSFAKPEDAIKYRKSAFSLLGTHFGGVIGPMATGKVPFDAKVVAANAEIANTLAQLPWKAFTEGSDKGDTKAKAEIWSKRADFDKMAKAAGEAIAQLNVAAKSGNVDAVKAAFSKAGGTCKECHDAFKSK